MDKFYEQLITTSKSAVYKFLNLLMYCSFIFAVFYFLLAALLFSMLYFIAAAIVLILGFVFRIFRNRQYKEYEYIFTNGNLQIDTIYNKSKRKTLIDEDVKNFDAFGRADEIKVPDDYKKYFVFLLTVNQKYMYFLLVERGLFI
ncbi:DUF6106 family protein [Caloramator sp. Dgby_cultured_2]|uniref:DUF6106 family protein n=1 Tax=Caloramator sp. Dgby_cultured_2 TaxID=3029174 RepID=UPI00237D38B6|nr:DUF6106 family protein [Caloramator sp. Dgby_cultured_2]WDU83753.1 DUF6106 family protein [Caloramator sp. Dgby_cultured_2]